METNKHAEANGTFTFKTNINCGGCVTKISPLLNSSKGINQWSVDTTDKNKLLTVLPDGITASEVVEIVRQAGFNIEPIQQ